MRTQLRDFCLQFDGVVRPVLAPVAAVLAALDAAGRTTPGTAHKLAFTDLQHHLQTLCDKVSSQEAYVLIFGPLKSGKSTLMNAIAAAYVSEVSSLPAYPCLVFVSAGERRDYGVQRYDGSTQPFTDSILLHQHIHEAHTRLAAAIRTAESNGQEFDPQEHFPQAVRRVDVHVDGSALAATGAVLVDTPGLYTRMRFGYDRMTRDFRDAAACAIFVVKSDTLFLEQVFAEFQQLLNLFSRIFLVVNVDAQKRDVTPDGKLVPALEQSQPELVLQAFTDLAMSAPLKRAAAEGRVRMYPVDLLHAASAVLQQQPVDQQPAGFVKFRTELTDYLASTEYLRAFLRDSLQRANSLMAELGALCGASEFGRLRARQQDATGQLESVRQEQQRLQQLLRHDWSKAFAAAAAQVQLEIERSARDEGANLLRTLGASIDTWFLSSHSLDWLLTSQWTPLLQEYRNCVLAAGRAAAEQTIQQADAGLDLPAELAELLQDCDIDLRRLRSQALAGLAAPPWRGKPVVPVDVHAIPIKRGVLDVVAFRSVDKVRHRLFGDKDKPDVKVQARDKAARMGEPGRLYLHQQVVQFRAELAPASCAALQQHFGAGLLAATTAALRQALTAQQPRLASKAAELQQELDRLQAVLEPLARLQAAITTVPPKTAALASQFGAQLAAADRTGPVLQPQPRPTAPPARNPESRRERR